jgi:hypothetical protein
MKKEMSWKKLCLVTFGLWLAVVTLGAIAIPNSPLQRFRDGIMADFLYKIDGSFGFYTADVVTAITNTSGATSANTANAIVKRGASGEFSAGTITAALTGNVTGDVSGSSGSCIGNAATVTNGVYSNGSYSDPSWLTISKSKVGLGSVANALQAYAADLNTGAVASTIAQRDANAAITASYYYGSAAHLTDINALPSGAWGDILFYGTSGWTVLNAGDAGKFLKTLGAGADPAWATPAGAGNTTSPATNTADFVPQWDGANSNTLKDGYSATAAATASTLVLRDANAAITAVKFYDDGDAPTLDTQLANKKYVDDNAGDTLPSQTGNNGKYLSTNGSAASWAAVAGGTQAVQNYTADFVINSALTCVSNSGATANIKATLEARSNLGDGWSCTIINEAPGSATKLTPSAEVHGTVQNVGTLADITDGSTSTTTWYNTGATANLWIGFQFSGSTTVNEIKFYVIAASSRIKTFSVERYDGGSWTAVPVTSTGANTSIYNTTQAIYDNAETGNGWATVYFTPVADTEFRVSILSRSTAGDDGIYFPEMEMYLIPFSVSIAPASGEQLPGTSAANRLLKSSVHGDSITLKATSANIIATGVYPAVANWVDTAP